MCLSVASPNLALMEGTKRSGDFVSESTGKTLTLARANMAFLQKREAHRISVPQLLLAPWEVTSLGDALWRYLFQQQYDHKHPNLPPWFQNYGTANVCQLKLNHLQQAFVAISSFGTKKTLPAPTLIAPVSAKLKAIGPPASTFR